MSILSIEFLLLAAGVLILYYLEGFRTGEIAQILGMPEATVRTRLKRGRDRLAEEYHGGKANE